MGRTATVSGTTQLAKPSFRSLSSSLTRSTLMRSVRLRNQACPGQWLILSSVYYNDYNLEYNEAKTDGARRIVELIQSYGVK